MEIVAAYASAYCVALLKYFGSGGDRYAPIVALIILLPHHNSTSAKRGGAVRLLIPSSKRVTRVRPLFR
jgi:hypothetical protein